MFFYLTEVEINVKSVVVEEQEDIEEEPDEEDKDDEEILKKTTRVTLRLKKRKSCVEYKFWRKRRKSL
jgi:hypothetical protein